MRRSLRFATRFCENTAEWSPEVMLEVNWGAAALGLLVAGGASEAIRRAFQAPDILYRLYHEDQARTRAGIESDQVLPRLAILISQVIARVGPAIEAQRAHGDDAELQSEVQDSLQAVDYLRHLRELSELYGDHRDTTRVGDEAQRWARRKGWAALVFLAGFLGLMGEVVFEGVDWPRWTLYPAGAFALIGITVSVTSWMQEISARNRLVALFRKYGVGE
jgi:hypothetical protein